MTKANSRSYRKNSKEVPKKTGFDDARIKMTAEEYCDAVLSGQIDVCKWVKLACKRHQDDLERDWEYYFDPEQGQKYIDFIELLSLTKGKWAGSRFEMEGWQRFIVWNLFGWRRKSDGGRRFVEATINVCKKNGKTELAAAISLAVAFLDNEHGGQIYMAATARDQAALCFETAKSMVKLTPELHDFFRVWQHAITYEDYETSIKPISAEASTAEGKGSSFVAFDEYHEQRTDELRDNLVSGMAARENPLFLSISTAGTDRNRPYYKHLQTCKQILEGTLTNDRHFIVIYTIDDGDNWKDEKVWRKANPNYGVSVKPEFLKKQFNDTQNEPSKEPNFKTKHLDVWTDAHTTWISHDVWMKGKRDIKLEQFAGRECYMGLDLANSLDFNALSILFPDGDKFTLFNRFWIPENMAKKRTEKDKIMIMDWVRAGWITLTPGDVADYNFIQAEIEKYAKMFLVKGVAYDPYNATNLVSNLVDKGVNMLSFSQQISNISPAVKRMEKEIIGGNLIHEGNPVMSWQMGNVQIFSDANENKKIHKGHSTDKVDGPVSVANAFGAIIAQKPTFTYYAV